MSTLASAVASDTSSTGGTLFKDATNNYLYISYNGVLSLISSDANGIIGTTLDSTWTDNYYGSSSIVESVAVERQSDGTFILAIKDTYKTNVDTNINWRIHKVSSSGYLDYANSTYTQSISSWETKFNQDLNLDGTIGIGTLTTAASDTTGARVKRDNEKGAFIDKDGNDATTDDIIQVKDKWGNDPSFNTSSSWSDGINTWTSKQEAYAAELKDGVFLLAIKSTNSDPSSSTKERVSWSIHKVSSDGTFDWQNSVYTESISKFELDFNQDLNGDNIVGKGQLTPVGTDTTGVRLKRDKDKGLYIVTSDNDAQAISITDSSGGTPYLEYENSWTSPVGTGASGFSKRQAVAVEEKAGGGYILALKDTSSYGGSEKETTWTIHELDNSGKLDWSNTTWSRSIIKWEKLFNQDLNGDGETGSTSLQSVGTDTHGARLKKDVEKNLYISDGSSTIQITDNSGNAVSFDYSNSYSDGTNSNSWSQTAVAVEKDDSSYLLAVKNTNINNGKTDTQWGVHTIDSGGNIDWGKSSWGSSIAKWEPKFNQDLNKDGTVGRPLANLTSVATDKTGAKLKRDSEKGLYIDEDGINSTTNDILEITDPYGGSPTLDHESSWSNGSNSNSYKSESIAIEKQIDNSFLLAVKHTDTQNGSSKTTWAVHTITSSGVQDWNTSKYNVSIQKWEENFNQDLNLDGIIGKATASSLNPITSDTTGSRLKRDAEDHLYIDVNNDGTTLLEVSDPNGGNPKFKEANSWSDTLTSSSWSQEAVAVEQQTDGSFRMAVKNTNTYNGNTETNWNVITLSPTGIIDWSSSSWGAISKWEPQFNQDLNLDGSIGRSTNLNSVTTDTSGARLRKDPENGMYIDVDGTGTTIIEIKDSYGGAPRFDYSGSWSDGNNSNSWESKAYAVQSKGTGYVLAVRHKNSYNNKEDINWNVYNINSNGEIDWSTSSWGAIIKWETDFDQDLNGDESKGFDNLKLSSVSTDTAGVGLKKDSENALYIHDGDKTPSNFLISDSYGGTPSFENSSSWSDGTNTSSWTQSAIAVDRQTDGTYRLAVRNSNTYNGSNQVDWAVYTISATGVLDWSTSKWYQSSSEIPKEYFSQDLSEYDSTNELVSERADVLIGNNGNTATAANSPVSVQRVDNLTASEIEKATADVGTAAEIKPLTDLLDFRITIANTEDYGSIQTAKFRLSATDKDLTYYKKDSSTGKYYAFNYDSATGEGARFSKSNESFNYNDILTVYIRDNGKHDSNATLGVIDDPGFVGSLGTQVAATTTPTPAAISGGGGGASSTGAASTPPQVVPAPAETTPVEASAESQPEQSGVLGIQPQAEVNEIVLATPLRIGKRSLETAIVGTNKSDRIIGSNEGEVLAGGSGKDKITGGGGADAFLFEAAGEFGKRNAKIITDFNKKEEDVLALSSSTFAGLTTIKFRSASGKKEAKQLMESRYNIIYDAKKGALYYNQNSQEEGFGDGGFFAILKGAPDLGKADFSVLS